MKRVIAVMACGASLAACESFQMPSMDFSAFKPAPPTVEVRMESEPAGAEAKSPTGPACRTPCTLTLPANGTTTVAFSLQGYQPTSVAVSVTPATGGGVNGPADSTVIDPNPVFAQLQMAPPPPPPRKVAKPKPKPKPKPAPTAQQAPAPAAPPPQQQGFGPPQQQQPAQGGFGPPQQPPPQSVFR